MQNPFTWTALVDCSPKARLASVQRPVGEEHAFAEWTWSCGGRGVGAAVLVRGGRMRPPCTTHLGRPSRVNAWCVLVQSRRSPERGKLGPDLDLLLN
jgi:hypothetical protein